ncbi:MAG: pyrimidine-nucleoside phosphorylase [Turicibacter sp.]|uniref:Pyrimidine-nucleoside phosphorylase n=1 Tax=Turicibacter faecis TaxID=2963365 RepID=A0ABM8IJC7_9FIRM|nr:pyrimidine-nucleoside phosphorylase [Turicibacter sp. TA25]MCI8701431.1 pyrimidine-nucleoside phosphorylase [Turicibacter sp.]MCU7203746.1 pyrimidine-nucleoside phosphorylase [Turicibacter sp. TA25]BEH91355.1 pyrimidine-nucleoside phosphorylase [Turicibacter sp. TC023]
MRMVDLIAKKRDHIELTTEEIEWMIRNYTDKVIPDYQMSAFLMAVVFNGMTPAERLALTQAMVGSGEVVDLSAIEGIKVDKHSTGGVGDKTSLILGPLVASMGVPVAKMSGRGLGHTGGTLDKLESISGMTIELDMERFIEQVNEIKLAIIGQTGNLAPADKYLYALRDVTATVESIPLIASSIMSKKIAAGADAIVLDVKFGAGAFMKTLEDAKQLAQAMVEIGRDAQRQTVAFLTDMNQPLGLAIGNALEVKEAIETLKGHGPKDLEELVLQLASQMVVLAKKAPDVETAYEQLKEKLHRGEAFNKFKEFVQAQGGDVAQIENPDLLPKADSIIPVKASQSGYVHQIDALSIGLAAMKLGAGRATKDDMIDMAVGVVLDKKVGDSVGEGDVLAYIHANRVDNEEAIAYIQKAYCICKDPVCPPTLIYDVIA